MIPTREWKTIRYASVYVINSETQCWQRSQNNISTSSFDAALCVLKLKLIYDRQSVGQSVLVSGAHLGPATNSSFCLKFSLDNCGFVIL
jgi:hypothetical protein